ncbi:protein arginine kinase [Vallitalea maricola]|uniref:Protein arginine kinase n=1 Tax=Vallitalea maricola TaxID=3074433 RepID=A0ACB5UJ94_9FIRM|nr:protein arginine kinase [Vallitalea sp. AN17-2]
MLKWFEKSSGSDDVVISSRVRLARNIEEYNFPSRLSKEDAGRIIDDVKEAVLNAHEDNSYFHSVDMNNLSSLEKVAMVERHVVSPNFVQTLVPTGLILSEDESISIMINEEDHLRIQSITNGLNLDEALQNAYRIDDLLEEKINYAYDENIGYLTSCPTNVGTGLRASYMIHVPALETTGKLQFILDAIGKFGITVRGIYGEGSKARGSVFQISNQITLGHSEQEIIDNLTSLTKQIVEQERALRNKLLSEKRLQFEDAVYRSYGILAHARIITSKEAMTLLSDIKLGYELGILKSDIKNPINIYGLMTCIQPANLQKKINKELKIDERDIERATYIRNNLPKII